MNAISREAAILLTFGCAIITAAKFLGYAIQHQTHQSSFPSLKQFAKSAWVR